MVSSFSAVDFAPLHYRNIEKEKILALQKSKGNFESTMIITDRMKSDLIWWIDNLPNQKRLICHDKVSKVAKIRNRYNQVPHLTQDTNRKVTNPQKTPQTRAKRSALSQQVTTKHI